MIKWIDERSILKSSKKTFRAGDIIPAGFLTTKRVEKFIKLGKVEIAKKVVPTPEFIEKNKSEVVEEKVSESIEEKTETKKARQKRFRRERAEKKKSEIENTGIPDNEIIKEGI